MSDPYDSPMMRQYRELKARDPDALLFFRMGDFYEMFGDDAVDAADLLGLTLTSRDKNSENPMPMAGFPHPALEQYLVKIIAAGRRAAVCEQMEDPRTATGSVVKRDIVRVVSPGTLTEDSLLDPRSSNHIAAVFEYRGKMGLAVAELSTGRFAITHLQKLELVQELARLTPSELIVCETQIENTWLKTLRGQFSVLVTPRPSWDFLPDRAFGTLCQQFGTTTLAGFGVDDDAPEIPAAGALIAYLIDTQKAALRHIHQIRPYRVERILGIDPNTRRALELTRTIREGKREGSLLAVIDRTASPMGARMLGEWLAAPLVDRSEITARHDAVEELFANNDLRSRFRRWIAEVSDLERLSARVGTGRATPRDLLALGRTLLILPEIKSLLSKTHAELLKRLDDALELCPEIRSAILTAIADNPPVNPRDGGVIREQYHPLLDELRDAARGGKNWIATYQADQIRSTGIPSLKVGFNKVFGYYVEVTNVHSSKVPAEYVRKQTVKNAERYITPELKEYEDKVLRAEERARELEAELFQALRDRVAAETPRLVQAGGVLAALDTLCALAELAIGQNYVRPTIVEEPVLAIRAGRHPVLDARLSRGEFVPNDTQLGPESGWILVITGPNMAGKSTYIRQVALITILAQMGSFVPAAEATVGLTDRVFARVGASDELSRGQSTFLVEMSEAANILHNATDRSLVILDEVGRGTSTFDGVSLAWAITEYLHDQVRCRALFATHYHELVDLEKSCPSLRNANVAVDNQDGEIVFLHRIVQGGADQSHGIHVARLAGVPAPVLDRARQILDQLETQHAAMSQAAAATHEQQNPSTRESSTPRASAPRVRVKTARGLTGSLFAALPDPLVLEIQETDPESLTPEQALDRIRRWKSIVN
jgi:DNA mismatch repair protein MutS